MGADRSPEIDSELSVALLVIGKSDSEIQWFKDHSPHVDREARATYVANPSMKFGGMAAIANPFLDAAAEDVVGVVHADTTFAPGVLSIFARTATDYDCVAGIVGRSAPDPSDFFSGYVWCHTGGGPVSTLDSCSIFLRRSHNLRFDGATFDSFHCVVEDICLQAQRRGIHARVPAAQANHASSADNPQWTAQYGEYRSKLVAKYPDIIFYTV